MMYERQIAEVTDAQYSELSELWAASVAKTHNFLPNDFIPKYKPILAKDYFPSVQLYGLFDEQRKILGFSGVSGDKLEMLFIHPDYFGLGLGSMLLNKAIIEQGVTKVDVNEQNPDALTFYLKHGFQIVSRSELDEQGNPFPILHLSL
jgi:putative acetyltransferase